MIKCISIIIENERVKLYKEFFTEMIPLQRENKKTVNSRKRSAAIIV